MSAPQIQLIPIESIQYSDSERHRKEIGGIEELIISIKKHGLLHPIILTNDLRLLAGRRRLEAFKQMGQDEIPARLFGDLSPTDQKLVELDENLRRQDITWQERVAAVLELHELLGSETASETAEYIGLSVAHVSKYLSVAQELRKGDQKVSAATTASAAIAIVDRRRAVAFDTELSKLAENIKKPTPTNEPIPIAPFSIQQGDFISWARSYNGPKFNFIHCDFPYGLNVQSSASMRSEDNDSNYEDTPEIFWELTNALIDNFDNIAYSSCHLLFWFSMKYYNNIVELFRSNEFFVHEIPLVWHKSDGAGIASDFRRRPKHVYETALWMSKGDRFISNVVNDVYACPIAKNVENHLSAKPQAMLTHFLKMGVSDQTDFLDPTCGSGTSIRAAQSLGAARAFGLELQEEVAKHSQAKLEEHLRLQKASSLVAKSI